MARRSSRAPTSINWRALEKTPFEFDATLNIAAVASGARRAFLLESANFKDDHAAVDRLLNRARLRGFYITYDTLSHQDYPRYFITRERIAAPQTDTEIAALLGLSCPGHAFDNKTIDHIATSIHVQRDGVHIAQPFAEVCGAGATLDSLIAGYRAILPPEYTVQLDTVELPSVNTMVDTILQGKTSEAIQNEFWNVGLTPQNCPMVTATDVPAFRAWLFERLVMEPIDNSDEAQLIRFVNDLYAVVKRNKQLENVLF
jgi:hypothetical protein